MVKSRDFVRVLQKKGLSPFLMVPCSIFKPLNLWMLNNGVELTIVPNEANAMGMAVGTYAVTGKPSVIFLQNSGLNNIANAQTSLHALYKIPVLLVVSWRGEPGRKDAPEHQIMGKITENYLKLLDIPYEILENNWKKQVEKTLKLIKKENRPAALLVKEGLFDKETFPQDDLTHKYSLSRMEALEIIKKSREKDSVFISTNGFTSRDSFAVLSSPDFYMMGSMGHAFSTGAGTALALAEEKKSLKTIVLDGDGGCLMHFGSMALVNLPKIKNSNLIYVLLDNEAHESTGSQPTLSPGIDFLKVAEGLGFPQGFFAKTPSELRDAIKKIKPGKAAFLHIKINRQKSGDSIRVSDKYTCEQITKRYRDNFK